MNDKIDILGERIMSTRRQTKRKSHLTIDNSDRLFPARLYSNPDLINDGNLLAGDPWRQLPRKKHSIGIQVDLTHFEYDQSSMDSSDL